MPFRRRRSYRRNTRYPRSSAYRRRVPVVSNSQVNYKVPKSLGAYRGEYVIRKLRFALNEGATHTTTSTSGALSANWVYRANDLYDCYQGASGQQPRTFDQIMALYRNFVVLGSKITVNFGYGTGSATSNDLLISVVLKDGATAMANAQDLMEQSRRRYKYLTTNSDKQTLVHKYSWKINGIKDAMDNPNLYGTNAASPAEGWYYHIIAYCPGGETETGKFTGFIDYTAVFFHALQPDSS